MQQITTALPFKNLDRFKEFAPYLQITILSVFEPKNGICVLDLLVEDIFSLYMIGYSIGQSDFMDEASEFTDKCIEDLKALQEKIEKISK